MEGSPLGNAFGDAVGRGRGKKSFLLIAVAATLGLGGAVLASNITVNSGGTVEFGQGVATTTPCDSAITVTPTSQYNGTANKFYLQEVNVTNIDSTTCNTRVFTVSVYASGVALPTAQATATNASATSMEFNFATAEVETQFVDNITVETNN